MEKSPITINVFLEKLRAGEKNFQNIILQNADFTGMNLEKTDFSGSDMSNSNFSSANLSEANFSEAVLARCLFKGSQLRGTNFERANLEWAIFTGAIFESTNFHKANLMWAHLCKSDLMRANISEAIINWACLADSKLSVEQMAGIPTGAVGTITFTYDVSQPGGKTIYGPGNPSLAGYGAGNLVGGYLGQQNQEGESEHDKAEKQAFYGKSGAEAAQGYGIIKRQDEAAAPAPMRRLRLEK